MERQLTDTDLKSLTVLYVEDEPLLREQVAAYLRRRVRHLFLASNGLEALEVLDTHTVDVVITDLMMPKMDGLQLSEEIRKRRLDLPILIATAISDISVMQSTIALGIDRYMIKPLDVEVVVEALTVIAKRKKSTVALGSKPVDPLTSEVIQQLEAECAKIIKAASGKGPDKVQFLVQANLLEIVIKGSRTKLELTLLTQEDNVRIVDFIRETLYRHLNVTIKTLIKDKSGLYAQLQQVICDSKRDVDLLKWILD